MLFSVRHSNQHLNANSSVYAVMSSFGNSRALDHRKLELAKIFDKVKTLHGIDHFEIRLRCAKWKSEEVEENDMNR